MNGPVAALLGDGSRLHLQHGPIDLIIGVDPVHNNGRQLAFAAAARRFDTVLAELASELAQLRAPMSKGAKPPEGCVARRMDRAVRPHADSVFVTRMAAVAGAVADEILASMLTAAPLSRAYVNNGGDIALHLAPGHRFSSAMAGLDGRDLGRVEIQSDTAIRGIATSGQGGRSLSFGIADSVTVLARNAAAADVAATLIANAVTLPGHPEVRYNAACELQPDSDLGAREVVTFVGRLSDQDIADALDGGTRVTQQMIRDDRIGGACLSLRGSQKLVGAALAAPTSHSKMVEYV